MPLQIPEEELKAIVKVVVSSPFGASISELLADPGLDFKRRTLQRRLDLLTEQGRIVAQGKGRGRRYVSSTPTLSEEEEGQLPATNQKWLSSQGGEIRAAINRPMVERTPVGYQASFLAAYEPNHSAYLSPEICRQLEAIGQVGISDLPAGTYLRQVMDRLLIDLSWNSSRLEGNTYSLLETQRLLERGESAEGKEAEDAQMILNHKAAIEMLADQAEEVGFNRYTICNLHALLSDNLLADPAACGRLRSRAVAITGTVFHPLEVPQLIEERLHEILGKAGAIEDPFEQAFFSMVHIPYLQPFEDVNKRVSRLAANIPLVRRNLCPLSFTDVPQGDYLGATLGVYELNRVEYLRDLFVWAYRRSAAQYSAVRQSLGDPDLFRLRYRSRIGVFVRKVVQGVMEKRTAIQWITRSAGKEIGDADRTRFVEVVEIELDSLHEGNIARYRLRPAEFGRWREQWR